MQTRISTHEKLLAQAQRAAQQHRIQIDFSDLPLVQGLDKQRYIFNQITQVISELIPSPEQDPDFKFDPLTPTAFLPELEEKLELLVVDGHFSAQTLPELILIYNNCRAFPLHSKGTSPEQNEFRTLNTFNRFLNRFEDAGLPEDDHPPGTIHHALDASEVIKLKELHCCVLEELFVSIATIFESYYQDCWYIISHDHNFYHYIPMRDSDYQELVNFFEKFSIFFKKDDSGPKKPYEGSVQIFIRNAIFLHRTLPCYLQILPFIENLLYQNARLYEVKSRLTGASDAGHLSAINSIQEQVNGLLHPKKDVKKLQYAQRVVDTNRTGLAAHSNETHTLSCLNKLLNAMGFFKLMSSDSFAIPLTCRAFERPSHTRTLPIREWLELVIIFLPYYFFESNLSDACIYVKAVSDYYSSKPAVIPSCGELYTTNTRLFPSGFSDAISDKKLSAEEHAEAIRHNVSEITQCAKKPFSIIPGCILTRSVFLLNAVNLAVPLDDFISVLEMKEKLALHVMASILLEISEVSCRKSALPHNELYDIQSKTELLHRFHYYFTSNRNARLSMCRGLQGTNIYPDALREPEVQVIHDSIPFLMQMLEHVVFNGSSIKNNYFFPSQTPQGIADYAYICILTDFLLKPLIILNNQSALSIIEDLVRCALRLSTPSLRKFVPTELINFLDSQKDVTEGNVSRKLILSLTLETHRPFSCRSDFLNTIRSILEKLKSASPQEQKYANADEKYILDAYQHLHIICDVEAVTPESVHSFLESFSTSGVPGFSRKSANRIIEKLSSDISKKLETPHQPIEASGFLEAIYSIYDPLKLLAEEVTAFISENRNCTKLGATPKLSTDSSEKFLKELKSTLDTTLTLPGYSIPKFEHILHLTELAQDPKVSTDPVRSVAVKASIIALYFSSILSDTCAYFSESLQKSKRSASLEETQKEIKEKFFVWFEGIYTRNLQETIVILMQQIREMCFHNKRVENPRALLLRFKLGKPIIDLMEQHAKAVPYRSQEGITYLEHLQAANTAIVAGPELATVIERYTQPSKLKKADKVKKKPAQVNQTTGKSASDIEAKPSVNEGEARESPVPTDWASVLRAWGAELQQRRTYAEAAKFPPNTGLTGRYSTHPERPLLTVEAIERLVTGAHTDKDGTPADAPLTQPVATFLAAAAAPAAAAAAAAAPAPAAAAAPVTSPSAQVGKAEASLQAPFQEHHDSANGVIVTSASAAPALSNQATPIDSLESGPVAPPSPISRSASPDISLPVPDALLQKVDSPTEPTSMTPAVAHKACVLVIPEPSAEPSERSSSDHRSPIAAPPTNPSTAPACHPGEGAHDSNLTASALRPTAPAFLPSGRLGASSPCVSETCYEPEGIPPQYDLIPSAENSNLLFDATTVLPCPPKRQVQVIPPALFATVPAWMEVDGNTYVIVDGGNGAESILVPYAGLLNWIDLPGPSNNGVGHVNAPAGIGPSGETYLVIGNQVIPASGLFVFEPEPLAEETMPSSTRP